MQAGKLDRDKLGEEFALFVTDERLQAAAPRLKAMGEPETVEVSGVYERGGMEVASIHFKFKNGHAGWTALSDSPDGKIQQFLIRKQ